MSDARPSLVYAIPAHNAAGTIGATLASLVAQTCPDWEALVVDDGSRDATAEVVATIAARDGRVRLISQSASGPAGARNRGLRESSAGFVCFLDADDAVEAAHAERMIAALGDGDAVACGLQAVDARGEPLTWVHLPEVGDERLDAMLEWNRFQPATVVVRRSVLERMIAQFGCAFDADLKCEDWEFMLKLARMEVRWATPVREALVRYTRSGGTRSTQILANYRSGREAVARHAPGDATAWLRRLAVRTVGQCVGLGERGQANAVMADVGSLTTLDDGVLAPAIRMALLADPTSSRLGHGGLMDRAAARVAAALPEHRDPRGLAARVGLVGDAWGTVTERALAMLGPGQMLVVLGMGRNGREVASRVPASARDRVRYADDRAVECGLARVEIDALGPGHVVLVTPFERGALAAQASRSGARVVVPEALVG